MVAFAQRNVEALGEVEDHLAARPCPPRLDEAEMARRDGGSHRDLELAEVALLPPLAQQCPGRRCTPGDGHGESLAAGHAGAYLIGNRRARPPWASSDALEVDIQDPSWR